MTRMAGKEGTWNSCVCVCVCMDGNTAQNTYISGPLFKVIGMVYACLRMCCSIVPFPNCQWAENGTEFYLEDIWVSSVEISCPQYPLIGQLHVCGFPVGVQFSLIHENEEDGVNLLEFSQLLGGVHFRHLASQQPEHEALQVFSSRLVSKLVASAMLETALEKLR